MREPVNPEPTARVALEEQFALMAGGSSAAKGKISALLAQHTGAVASEVAVSSAKGGTKQLLNRLGQSEVSKGKQVVIFLLDDVQHVGPSVAYVVDAVRGRNDARAPAGPVAFVAPSPSGLTVSALVVSRPTKVSEYLIALFSPAVSDPRASIKPVLPAGGALWLLMSNGETTYYDIDGIRYHFPTTIPNGQNVKSGDVVVTARTKGSSRPDAGAIFGVGRVGRRIPTPGGSHVYAYFDRFLRIDPPLDLDAFGNPRTNVNSIVALKPEWVEELFKTLGVERVDELPVPFTALTLEAIAAEVAARDLIFAEGLLTRVLAALRSGKHLMFTGAPGTGKTSLALAVATAASRAGLCAEPLLTTGTADWTSADTVGAYRLTQEQELKFHAGHVVSAIEDDRWLVIDELNRADIDKAIGQLFTALSGQAVVLPFDDRQDDEHVPISIVPPGELPPPHTVPRLISQNWRLLATLNDRDRDLLFDMSEALMRRFAVIEVEPPSSALWGSILAASGGTGHAPWDLALQEILKAPALQTRPLGAAVLLDCVRHLRQVAYLHEERGTALAAQASLQEALDLYLKPQLRTVGGSVTLNAKALLAAQAPVADIDAGGSSALPSP